MNNRVDYLSDRLVNLRGKHKKVDEVIPPDSIANGVSIKVPSNAAAPVNKSVAQSSAIQAQERRREQTWQLGNDLEHRMLKRQKQIELRLAMFAEQSAALQTSAAQLNEYCQALKSVKLDSDEELSASELGERYRAIDKLRLSFFDIDAQLEMIMSTPASTPAAATVAQVEKESFKDMLKKGLAWALTAGMVIAGAILLAAAIIFSAWN